MPLDDDGPAKNIGGSSRQAEQKTENDGVHRAWE
jgi:hypothetical protein